MVLEKLRLVILGLKFDLIALLIDLYFVWNFGGTFFIFLFLYFIFICLFWKAIDAMLDWSVAKSVSLVSSSLLFMSKVYVCRILISQ